MWKQQKDKELGTLPDLQHFKDRGACWSFGIGIRKSDKQINYSHRPAQTKQQVGSYIVWALLVHEQAMGKHRLTKFTMAPTFPL
jgi:hypothetical protein